MKTSIKWLLLSEFKDNLLKASLVNLWNKYYGRFSSFIKFWSSERYLKYDARFIFYKESDYSEENRSDNEELPSTTFSAISVWTWNEKNDVRFIFHKESDYSEENRSEVYLVLIRLNEEGKWVQDFLLLPQGFESLPSDLLRARWHNLMCVGCL